MIQTASEIRRVIPDAASEGVWVAPDGYRLRRIDWGGGRSGGHNDDGRDGGLRGSLLFLPGRGDSYEKYLEAMQGFYLAGWRVTGLDWRGQAGSGRLGLDATTGHVADFGVWVDDLVAFWREWCRETPGPHVVLGHSMGGHIVLRALEDQSIDPAAAVLVAPMLAFAGVPLPYALLHGIAKLRSRMGDSRRPAWTWGEKPGQLPAGRSALLTHDAGRYADEEFWREERPELAMGPASWGWLEQALRSMRRIMAPAALARVRTPILIVAASADRLVSVRAIRKAAAALPDARLLEFGQESAHEILREVDPVRDRALAAIRDFLDQRAPPA